MVVIRIFPSKVPEGGPLGGTILLAPSALPEVSEPAR